MFLHKKEEQLNQYRAIRFSAEIMAKLLQNDSLMERARAVFENRGRFEEIWGGARKRRKRSIFGFKNPG